MTETHQYEELRLKLIGLVEHLSPASSEDIRPAVLELVPVHKALRSLGVSLFPDSSDAAARDRILLYLKRYQGSVIAGNELLVVGGIQEWARRLRELRTQFGWKIVSGLALSQLSNEEEEDKESINLPAMRPDEYVLVDIEQDTQAALRWNQANAIRKKKTASVKARILEYLRLNVGHQVSGEELRYVANQKSEWARRVRELRTDDGWPVVTKSTGRPDLPVGVYVLSSERQAPEHDRNIRDRDRRLVLRRAGYGCPRCTWTHEQWNPSDPRHLEVHHVIHHAAGGSNEPENLVALCNVCHDAVHAGEPLNLASL